MPLTPLMKERLADRDKLDIATKKANEYQVRQYVKNYFNDLKEVLWVLNTLPEKQINKLFQDEDIYRLFEITEKALVYLDSTPIQRDSTGKLIAVKRLIAEPTSDGSYRTFSIERETTEGDQTRYSSLMKHMARLDKHVQPKGHAIYNDLDRIYFKDLAVMAKKAGYKPVIAREREHYLPRLTPEQYWFEEIQGTLMGLGFRNINTQADIEILKEALHSDEGMALIEKFNSMREQPPK